MKITTKSLLLAAIAAGTLTFVGCGEKEPEGPSLSSIKDDAKKAGAELEKDAKKIAADAEAEAKKAAAEAEAAAKDAAKKAEAAAEKAKAEN